jgi:hypothetical protein
MSRDVAEFQPNVPARIALAYATGKTVESRFGERVMFSLSDGRVMFADMATAQKINDLKPRPNRPFYIVKNQESKRGSPVEWRVWACPEDPIGEQPDGTFVVPGQPAPAWSQEAETAKMVAAGLRTTIHQDFAGREIGRTEHVQPERAVSTPAPAVAPTVEVRAALPQVNGNGTANGKAAPVPDIHQGWAIFLLAQTNTLVDVLAAALAYSSQKYGNTIKPETVQSILLSAFIGQQKRGGCDVV